jgi:hypothetical protein
MNLLRTLKAVGWSFLGIRKSSGHQQDFGQLNPFAIVAVGLAAVAVFVGALIVLVNWVVH